MIWDKFAGFYDIAETIYNKDVYTNLGKRVAQEIDEGDTVLECACGTGAISVYIAQKCRKLIATDYAVGMLKQAEKKCRMYRNVTFRRADITDLKYKDESFDKVIAGNVIHLLPEPEKALHELERVVKHGGSIIIPTYINMSKKTGKLAVRIIEMLGADFKEQFDMDSYKKFFSDMGYKNVKYHVVNGRMPCAIAVIVKE